MHGANTKTAEIYFYLPQPPVPSWQLWGEVPVHKTLLQEM